MSQAHHPSALRLARLVLPAATLLALFSVGSPTPAGTPAPVGPASAVAGPAGPQDAVGYMPPEVRLRKLHLVRPDLIPYPIAYDVYC